MEHFVVRRRPVWLLISLGIALTSAAAIAFVSSYTLTLTCVRGGPTGITCSATESFWGLTRNTSASPLRAPGIMKPGSLERLELAREEFRKGEAPSLAATTRGDNRNLGCPVGLLIGGLSFAVVFVRKVVVQIDRHTGTVRVVRVGEHLTIRRSELPLSDVTDVVAGKHLPKNHRELVIMRRSGEPLVVTVLSWEQIDPGVVALRKFLLPAA
jgi:hypothetical protein